MKSNLVAVVVFLAQLTIVQCINLGKFFDWLKSPFSGSIGATASDCKVLKNRSKCKFDTNSLKFDVDNAIELVVNSGGRKIKCNKLLNKGKNRWYGRCDGDAEDANFITRIDKDGKESVHGSIQVGNNICRISPNLLGEQEIQCIPKTEFKEEDEPKDAQTEDPGKVRHLASDTKFGFVPSFANIKTQTPLRGNNNRDDSRQLFDNSGGNIDVMVVWTKAAECGNAGLASGCTVTAATENLMRGLIDLAIAETNTAYELSGILTALRLVHAYRDADYIETGGFLQYIEDVTYTGDGFMDGVHSKRTLYGADVVHMIVGDPSSCGIAWSSSVPSLEYMFSVSQYDCATGYFSFGHEIGHNVGMYHDRGTQNTCSEATTFNYGYRDPGAAFRTILSYDCKMGQCDAMPRNGCTRIQRFSSSNPAYTYNGKPIGDSRRDNAKQLNNMRARVASYFPSMNCQSNAECNDNNPTTFDTCNSVNRVCIFTPNNSVPVKSPTKEPTGAPAQINVPVQTNKNTNAPTMKPIDLQPPTEAPVLISNPYVTVNPTLAPTVSPTRDPTRKPTRTPTKMPTGKPTRAPSRAPLRPPTKVPVLPQTFFMESLKITGVTSTSWKIITLSKQYVSPIPVCTVMYNQGTTLSPAVTRMQKVGTTSFEIRLQNPSDLALTGRDVHCVVVEEGAWKLPDGRLIESKKYSSTVTDRKGSYIGQPQAYRNAYRNPVVLGQVMSYNDPKWSVFWSRSSSGQNTPPSSTSIITGKHIGEDTRTSRLAETVGYIVIESGHLKSNNIEIETGRGPDSFIGYTGRKGTLKFNSRFGTTPVVAVLSQAAMDDSDGSWAVLTSNPTTTSVGVSVDEDQLTDTERSHSTEEVNYAIFSSIGGIQLTSV